MNKLILNKIAILVTSIVFFLYPSDINANNFIKILGLQGKWKFNIGDDMEWAKEGFNDSNWESIYAPSPWENQGYYGYDGFAWYRKSFVIPAENVNKDLYAYLGYIDDADEVYFNGNLIGSSGSFPPNFSTAYNAFRKYHLPKEFVRYDKPNVIAVRVYDAQLDGGIVNGDLGIYADANQVPFEIDLRGMWKFRTGDNNDFKDPQYNDKTWRSIMVPKYWEDQGFPNYDGFAWYRKKFFVTGQYTNDRIVVVLGKIDDYDEVYLNGTYIGPIKKIDEYIREHDGNRYNEQRIYYIEGKLLQSNKINTIAVRVYDSWGGGGIYEGPVGIMKQKDFVQFMRSRKQ
jgi:hypothetical protein